MNSKLFFGLSVFAVAFALVFGFGSINSASAITSDSYNQQFVGEANLWGVDEAHNVAGIRDMDRDARDVFEPAFGHESDV